MVDAGLVEAGVVPVAVPFPAGVPVALTVPEVGELVGVAAGSAVIGVGNGGSGLERMLAIISVMPASDWLCRYLYQVPRLSIQVVLFAAWAGSVPARATARA